MDWKNVQRDELPNDGQEVLLSVNGVYYLTIYRAEKKLFHLRGEDKYFEPSEYLLVYWLPIETPETEDLAGKVTGDFA